LGIIKKTILAFFFLLLNSCLFNEVLDDGIGNTFVKITEPNEGKNFISLNKTATLKGICSKNIVKLETSTGSFLDSDCSDGTWALNSEVLNSYFNVFIISGQNISRVAVSSSMVIINEAYLSAEPLLIITNPNGGKNFISGDLTHTISGACTSNIISLSTNLGSFLDSDCSDNTWSLNPYTLVNNPSTFIISGISSDGFSISKTISITYDDIPPTAPIVSGTSPSTNKKPTWTWTSSGGGIGVYRYKLNSDDFSSYYVLTENEFYTPSSNLENAEHTLYVQESDEYNNWSDSGFFTISVVNPPAPSAPIVSGVSSTTNKKPTWTWTSSSDTGAGIYRYKLNSDDFSTNFNLTQNSFYTPSSNLENAEHTLYVQESDEYNNWSDSGFFSINIEAFKPVLSWGYNNHGQLGNNPTYIIPYFTTIENLEDIVSISAGENYTLALKADGELWSWGVNNYGQLGDASTTSKHTANLIADFTNVEKISAGRYHSLALKSDKTIWGWGYNAYGQLGLGNTSNRLIPTHLSSLNDFKDIAAGLFHSIALKNNNKVYTWGRNNYGQLGDGTLINRTMPIELSQDINGMPFVAVKQVSAGEYHNIALKHDGTVWAWGYNNRGQLGDGTTANKDKPQQVLYLNNIEKIVAGAYYNLALDVDGNLYAWGLNSSGQLGDGTTTQKVTPVLILTQNLFTSIFANNASSAAIDIDNNLWVWGNNINGNLGLNHILNRTVPTLNDSINNVNHTAIGYSHTIVLTNNISSCGSNNLGQLGLGFDLNKNIPTELLTFSDFEINEIVGGQEFSMSLRADGTVWAWGRNNYSQLGLANTTSQFIPTLIPNDNLLNPFDDIVKIATGLNFSLALRSDGSVWSWGYNNRGQLGLSNTATTNRPTRITSQSNFISISAGFAHSMALKADGSVWAWGYNNYGQLGLGNTTQRTVPFKIEQDINSNDFNNVEKISSAYEHNLALKADGSVWAWGRNNYGQLGDGTTSTRTMPQQLNFIENVLSICAGAYHSMALKADGSVWAWGYNNYGQLGDGTILNKTIPVEITSLANIQDIACGGYHSAAKAEDGTIYIWGSNLYGQLGIASNDLYFDLPQVLSNLLNVVKIGFGENHSSIIRVNQ